MKKSWTHGLDSEAEKDLRGNYVASLATRKRLKKLIEDKANSSLNASRSESAYENPNWAYLQADARGYERALNEIISLID